MGQLANADWLRGVFTALVVVGLSLAGYSAWRYLDADRELQGNVAQVIMSRQQAVSPGSSAEVQGLVGADVARRELLSQQYDVLMLGGGGLVILSLGWLGLNLAPYLRSRMAAHSGHRETQS
ncbi:MAG: hypothetical protein OXF44_14310 [Anaerolineaceae bacterium]|nr:hypothetical protein [Anaerolineaceae bacterium]